MSTCIIKHAWLGYFFGEIDGRKQYAYTKDEAAKMSLNDACEFIDEYKEYVGHNSPQANYHTLVMLP